MVAQLCDYTKNIELYILDSGIVSYVNHIPIKLFLKNPL